MASENGSRSGSRKRVGRKLTKKRPDRQPPPVDLPERFKDGADAQEDVTAPKGKNAQYMNQSVFSMIAAAGSKTNFHARFDDSSSDSEEEPEPDAPSQSEPALPAQALEPGQTFIERFDRDHYRPSERKILRPLPHLRLNTRKSARDSSLSSGGNSPQTGSVRMASPGFRQEQAPVMSRMLEAQAQLDSSAITANAMESTPGASEPRGTSNHASSLAIRLMEIFGLDQPEDVISEYPCWLLKSVLLQGYMYITRKHICFYAYLPKKSNVVAKSGYLSKRGRQNPKFNRYWFTLKGDVLAYYADPSNLYFPSGNIDLRYGISAAVSESKEKGKPATSFSVTTHERVYYFKADSPTSAKEWVRTLQKVIFRSHNDGDSVKVSLPIENVIDIDDSPVLEFAETVKIRVVDNDETYAIDEYFFSFFSFGREALSVLRTLVDDTPAQRISTDILGTAPGHDGAASPGISSLEGRVSGAMSPDHRSHSPAGVATPVLQDIVRATLSPLSPAGSARASPRPSLDIGRTSFDTSRRSFDINQDNRRPSFDRGRSASKKKHLNRDDLDDKSPLGKEQGSSDSFVHSVGRETESTDAMDSSDGTHASASQILNRSDVFQSPTIHRLHQQSASQKTNDDGPNSRRRSEEGARPKIAGADIRVHPPSRSQTLQTAQKQPIPNFGDGPSDMEKRGPLRPAVEGHSSSPSLQELVKAGSYPLQRAAGFAGYLKNRSKRMSNLLAAESMGYIEKVSGMWTGARRHYDDPPGLTPDEASGDIADEEDAMEHGDRFRAHFALQPTEKLQATYFGYLHRVLPLYGKIYISNRSFCFRSLLPGTRTKMILPLKDIENVDKEKGFRFGYSGLVIVIRGHEELFFEFGQAETRDDCAVTLLQSLETVRFLQESGLLSQQEKVNIDAAKAEHRMLQEARQEGHNEHDLKLPQSATESPHPAEVPPILFDDPRASIINFKPTESLRITCLTIGSRGDVQPYIALCKGLIAEGHRPKIATHAEFEPWVRKHGIDFATVDGDPAELMRICVENGMFTYSFIREASLKFRGWIDELLTSAWRACQDTDILIESPSAMAGIHIAEALGIPYFRAFTMPWTRTRAYPHAFAVPEHKMGGAYNYFTYIMFDNVFWKAIAGQVNRWRKKELHLPRTNLDKMQPNKVPFLYNFSPSVVVPPIDYSDWIRVTGYWFLDEAAGWQAPKELTDFIKKARKEDKKIVYVGFGSIVVSDPAALTKTIIDSVLKADVRCILSKGWSDRLGNKEANEPELPLPDSILQIKSAPHDWLFGQIDAAAHHGGAGTTGASLRAGLPTIVKPFFGDQFFFGSRVEDLGVGVCIKRLNVSVFSRALWECTHSERILVKAKVLGESIRKEDGVGTAIQAIYRDLEYAKTLVKRGGASHDDGLADFEESWTFIGDDNDPELVRRIAEWEPMVQMGHGHGHGPGHGPGHRNDRGVSSDEAGKESGSWSEKEKTSGSGSKIDFTAPPSVPASG